MSKGLKFNADTQPQGTSTVQFFDVDLIARDPATNGRFEGHDEDTVRGLALNILELSRPDPHGRTGYVHGQLQAVICERDNENRPFLVSGFGRCAAIDYINANVDDKEIKSHLERLDLLTDDGADLAAPFPVKVTIVPNQSKAQRRKMNIAENANRKELTPMDWAVIVREFVREEMSDGAIVEELAPYFPTKSGKAEISTSWVQHHRYLLEMSPETQRRVHNREIPISRAIELWRNARDMTVADEAAEGGERKVTTEEMHAEMDRQIAAVTNKDTGKIDAPALRARNRAQGAAQGRKSTLTLADFTRMVEKGCAQGSKVALEIFAALKGQSDEETFLSFLAESNDPALVPADGEDEKPAKGKGRGKGKGAAAKAEGGGKGKAGKGKGTGKGKAGKGKPEAEKPGKGRRGKAGADAPVPAVGSAPLNPAAAAAQASGVKLPPPASGAGRGRRPGGRTKPAPQPQASAETAPSEIVTVDVAPAESEDVPGTGETAAPAAE